MDDDVAGAAPGGEAQQPLTRRQLRLAAQEAERAREETRERDERAGEAADDDPDAPEAPRAAAEGIGADPDLPEELPEEPEVDDVRWDGPEVAGPEVAVPGPEQTASALRSRLQPPLPSDMEATRPVPRMPVLRPGDTDGGHGEQVDEQTDSAGPAVPPDGDTAEPPVPPVPAEATAPSGTRAWARDGELPTLDDLLAQRTHPEAGPAELGWRGAVGRVTGGLVRLPPGPAEQRRREDVAAVQREFDGPRTIVVVNPKGGAHKTTATLLLAATFGTFRGGYTLAWDNNETRGTLGWRSHHGRHTRTAVDLLESLDGFEEPTRSRVGDLDGFVRAQPARFDVLASDEDAASAASIDADAFGALHSTLSRFYRVLVVDTGNNMRASNWQAALAVADQVVLVTTVREDTAQSAAWAADALRAMGHEDAVRHAVTVLADPAVERDRALADRLHDHFGRLTRAVVDVPYDPALVAGGPLDVAALSPRTREAWLRVTATVARGL